MRDRLRDFEKQDAQLIAVDPHEVWTMKSLMRKSGLTEEALNYPLLADPALTVSAAYGVAFQMRIHTELSNRPATFLIDRDGVLRYEHRARTFSDRPGPEAILAELEKLP